MKNCSTLTNLQCYLSKVITDEWYNLFLDEFPHYTFLGIRALRNYPLIYCDLGYEILPGYKYFPEQCSQIFQDPSPPPTSPLPETIRNWLIPPVCWWLLERNNIEKPSRSGIY